MKTHDSRRVFVQRSSRAAMAGIFCFMFPKAEWLHAQLCESPSDIYPKVKSILVQQFKVKPTKITLSATLGNTLGLDSLHRVELFITLEETFNMEIPDTRCSAATTLRDIVSTIRSIRSRRCEGFAQSMTATVLQIFIAESQRLWLNSWVSIPKR